jgi:polyhydroxyalkanoate synthesis regulator protein
MQAFVPSYLQFSMDHLTREHERLREEMVGTPGVEMIKSMEDQARKNMAMFQDAMQLFNPFATMQNANGAAAATADEAAKPETMAAPDASSDTDLNELRSQIKTMQSQIEKLAGKD